MTLKFNNRLSITPVEEGGGSGVKIITATNSTGANISSGDKVFVNYKEFTGQNHDAAISKDFIASDFYYTDRYITFDKQFDFSKPWEFRCKVFRNDYDYGDQQNAFIYSAQMGSQDSLFAAGFCLFAGNNFSFYLNTTEGRQQLAGGQVNPNTTYWIRCGWTGTEYYLNYSTDNETFTSAITYQSTSPVTMSVTSFLVGISQWIGRFYWKGTIDLNEMSMTIDNTVVWQAVEEYAPKIVDYTDTNYYTDTGIAKENIAVGESGDVAVGSYINNQNKTITTNGTYTADTGYTGLGTVNVNVPVKKYGADINGLLGDVDANGVYHYPETESFDFIMDDVKSTEVALTGFMAYRFYGNKGIRNVSFANLETTGNQPNFSYAFAYSTIETLSMPKIVDFNGEFMCQQCRSLKSVNLDSLVSKNLANAFSYCISLTTLSLPSYTKMGWSYFDSICSNCTSLQTVNLPNLTSITGYNYSAFSNCTSLTSIEFPKLNNIASRGMTSWFSNCTSLQSISFPALTSQSFGSATNQFQSMLNYVTGCTVHFPSNLQSVIGSWSDVTSGFGGTNTTVLFDLPATE